MNNKNAYTAGYIDGDGCLYIGKYTNKTMTLYEYSIQIVSVKKPVLDGFKETFGGSLRMKPRKPRHKDAFCWTIKNTNAIKCAQCICPYLVDKINQCEIFIKFTQLITGNLFKTVDESLIEERNKLIELIRKDRHMNNFITKDDIEALKDKKLTITPTETDYPYLAGLIDSEGCFRIKKWKPKNKPNNVYTITVEIGNTKLPIMPWLIKRFGGSATFISARGIKRSSATWSISAASLYDLLPKIRPFLRSKKEICDLLIEFQQTILPNGGDRHSELFKALFEKRIEIRERIVAEVHQFNHKGSL